MKLMILYHEIFGEANTEHALKVCKASRCKWCKVSRKYDVFFVFCLLHFLKTCTRIFYTFLVGGDALIWSLVLSQHDFGQQ